MQLDIAKHCINHEERDCEIKRERGREGGEGDTLLNNNRKQKGELGLNRAVVQS